METEKIGVFGGTFNPVHLGHLHIARRTRELFDLREIQFVVATAPPHKPPEGIIPYAHRYTMVSLATAAWEAFVPSMVELEAPASPFSVHTMEKFARRQGGVSSNLYFVAGGDSLLDVSGWKESRELLCSYNFIFVVRPGFAAADVEQKLPPDLRDRIRDLRGLGDAQIREAAKDMGPVLFILDAGAPDISSSLVRDLVRRGKPFRHLVPGAVSDYIQKLHLYGEQ